MQQQHEISHMVGSLHPSPQRRVAYSQWEGGISFYPTRIGIVLFSWTLSLQKLFHCCVVTVTRSFHNYVFSLGLRKHTVTHGHRTSPRYIGDNSSKCSRVLFTRDSATRHKCRRAPSPHPHFQSITPTYFSSQRSNHAGCTCFGKRRSEDGMVNSLLFKWEDSEALK